MEVYSKMDLNTIIQSDMLYYILIGAVAVLLILVIVIIVAIKKSRKHRAEYEEYPEEDAVNESELNSDEEFDQQSEEESDEGADEGDDEPFEDEEIPENEESSEEEIINEEPEVAERHENNYIIEKSAQAHAKRHEKRDWQIESDEDKMNRGAYAEGVDFRYVPNKERYDRYKDMEDEENNAELGRKTFSVEQPEEFDEESAYQEELEFRENVKEEIQEIKNEVSVISESIQKMTEAFFNKNQELMNKMDSLANLQEESQYKLEAQSKESIDRYANVIGSTMDKSIDEGIEKIKKTNEEQYKALADTLEKMDKETKGLVFSVKNRQGENMGKTLASFGKLEATLAILTTSQDVLCQHKDVEDIIPKLNEMSEKMDARSATSVKHIEDDQMAVLKALRASVDRLNTKLSNLEVPVVHKETEQNKAKTSNNGQNFEVKKEPVEVPAVKPELEHKDSEKHQETKAEELKPVEQVKKEDAKPEEHKKHPESKAQSQLQPKSQNQPKQQTKPQAKKPVSKSEPKVASKQPANKPVKNTNVKSKAPVDKPKANQEQKESPKPHVRTKKVPYTSEQFHQKQLEEEKKREAQMDEEIRNSKLLVKTIEATAKPIKKSEVNEYKTKFQKHMEEKQRLEKEKAKQQANSEPVVAEVEKPQPVVADPVEPKPVVTEPESEPVSVVEEPTLKEPEVVEDVSSMGEVPYKAEQIQEFKPETFEEPEIVTEEPIQEEIVEPEESGEVYSEESVQDQSVAEDIQSDGMGVRPYERQTSHAQPARFTNSGGFISSGDSYSHPGDVGAYKRARASSRPARVANTRAQRASRPSRRTY